jgi:hypothetical protein
MAMQAGDSTQRRVSLIVWWARLIAHRQRIERTAVDLHAQYGAAAYALARNSARTAGGRAYRRHWRGVARTLRSRRFRDN